MLHALTARQMAEMEPLELLAMALMETPRETFEFLLPPSHDKLYAGELNHYELQVCSLIDQLMHNQHKLETGEEEFELPKPPGESIGDRLYLHYNEFYGLVVGNITSRMPIDQSKFAHAYPTQDGNSYYCYGDCAFCRYQEESEEVIPLADFTQESPTKPT